MKIAVCLHGYFGTLSTNDFTTAAAGYEHIKERIMSKGHEVDFYVHCWQPEYADEIIELYNPKQMVLKEQIDFSKICQLNEISQEYTDHMFDRDRTMFKNATFERILSFYYSRCEALELSFDLDYDWIITTRFDIGQRGGSEVNQIRFEPDSSPDYLYTTDWNQKNCGYGDMWFYGSENVMRKYSKIYKSALKDFKPDSEYEMTLTRKGWPDSAWFDFNSTSDRRQFTNEIDREQKSKYLMKFPKWRTSDSHLHHNWFCISNGLYDITRWV